MTNMTALQVVAMAKGIKSTEEKAASDQLAPGVHEVDFTVRISGSLTKGEDVPKTPTCRTPWLPAMALFLKRSGIQKEKSIEDLMQCIHEAILMDEKAHEDLYKEAGIEEIETRLKAEYAKLPKIRAAGQVRTALNMEIQR